MKNRRLRFGSAMVIFMGTLMVTSKVTAQTEGEQSLGHFPLCEASSALIVACPDGNGDCLIVGDNEQRNDLFLFEVKDGARVFSL